jgi:hypothetical protein
MALGLITAVLPEPAQAQTTRASQLTFSVPRTAPTGETVTAVLANPRGPSEDFTVDWGDGAPLGLFGNLSTCTLTNEGGVIKPGENPKQSGQCRVSHVYQSPGTFTVRATTKDTKRVFSATITITGPALRPVDARFTFSGLGPVTTNSTPFTVEATAGAPVCWYLFDGQRKAGPGPQTFTLDVTEYWPNSGSATVFVRFCDGGEAFESLPTTVPFEFSLFDGVVNAEPGQDRIGAWDIRNTTSETATASLLDGATELRSTTIPAGGSGRLTVLIPAQPASQPSRTYRLVISTASGLRTDVPVVSANGWSPDASGAFAAPCTTVAWSYEPAGQPRTASRMLSDIEATLRRIEPLTGLRFSRTAQPDAAQIRFRWSPGSDGLGYGTSRSATGRVTGTVDLGARYWYLSNAWRGFSRNVRQGIPGHNWAIAHGVLTLLGLDQTSTPRNLMNGLVSAYSTNLPQNARFGTGDRAGLAYLYQPQTCPR